MECFRAEKDKECNKERQREIDEGRTLKDAEHERHVKTQREVMKELRELFRLFDQDNDRTISLMELGKAMRFLGMCPTDEEIEDAMRALDINGNGRLEFSEFFNFMQAELAKLEEPEHLQREEIIRAAFRTFDKDGNGFIDASELKVAMKQLGESMSEQELDDMMNQADIDGDGQINYEEFVKVWCEAT